MARSIAQIDAFSERIDLLDLEVQASGTAPFFQQEKYMRVLVSRRTGLPLQGMDEEALRAQAGTYTEDLSDELGPAGDSLLDPRTYSTLWIRDE
jgi:hypothetical protein